MSTLNVRVEGEEYQRSLEDRPSHLNSDMLSIKKQDLMFPHVGFSLASGLRMLIFACHYVLKLWTVVYLFVSLFSYNWGLQ